MVIDAPSTLKKVIPIQHVLQAFNRNHNCTKLYPLPWDMYRCILHNTDQLSDLTVFFRVDDPAETRAIRIRAWLVRLRVGIARVERLLQYLIPPIPPVLTHYAILEYQTLCVVSRTYCENTAPELIELFTDLV